MSGMSGGMDMGSNMMFRPYNQKLALGYWYIIAGFVGAVLLCRGFERWRDWDRLVGFHLSIWSCERTSIFGDWRKCLRVSLVRKLDLGDSRAICFLCDGRDVGSQRV